MALKEEWDIKEEDSPTVEVSLEVSLEVKQEDTDESSVFHSIDEERTTNDYKVTIYSDDLLFNFPHFYFLLSILYSAY